MQCYPYNKSDPMFACQYCGATTFTLQTSEPLPQIEVSLNHAHEVVIKVEGYEPFVADTKFMNQFALCQGCGATHCWQPTAPVIPPKAPNA